MSARDILRGLGSKLEEQRPQLDKLDAYYKGSQQLSFLSPEAKAALHGRLKALSTNFPRLVVTSLAERLTVTGFTRDGVPDLDLWRLWERDGMGEQSAVAHREALTHGRSFALVWARPDGSPRVTIESAKQVAVSRDPADRTVTAAVKLWAQGGGQRAVTYEPDRITRWATDAPGAPADAGAWRVIETIPNRLAVVPVVPIVNGDRLLDVDGTSEMADVLDLTDALAKTLADMLVTSEFFARPRRWVTGIEVPVDDATGEPVNPFASEVDRTWISEDAESRFGQFDTTDLAAYENATKVLLQAIMAVSGLPAHYVGVLHDNPSSADAIRSAEASLTARALARQRTFGRAWADVARLVYSVRDGTDPAAVHIETQWANPESRTPAQTANAVTKLVQSGILPPSEALRQLGYTAEDIDRIRSLRRAEALDGFAVDLGDLAS